MHLLGLRLPVSQLSDKMFAVPSQDAVGHLQTQQAVSVPQDSAHFAGLVFTVQLVVDVEPALPHHLHQAFPGHHGPVTQHRHQAPKTSVGSLSLHVRIRGMNREQTEITLRIENAQVILKSENVIMNTS